MELENETAPPADSSVTTLQANLTPPKLTSFGSYFSNFFIKNAQFEEDVNEDDKYHKLKDSTSSKDLFPVNSDAVFTSQLARWPAECQVIEERISHISYNPPLGEPYYRVTGEEVQPKPNGEDCGIIVYQYSPISSVNYFSRSSVGGSKYLLPTNPCPEQDTLRFESRFECGNLEKAIRITDTYYELYLRADMYTNKHVQWFYFRVNNMKKEVMYRFSIINFAKDGSLYNEGMRPLLYSTKDAKTRSIGWRRCGQNITYFSNDDANSVDDVSTTYTLTFTVEFPYDDDIVYLAHSYPYSYTDLQNYLSELSTNPIKQEFASVRLLCKSLAGNNVYYVTITSPSPLTGEIKKKRAVVISARVHPGETPASWMVKGILDFLTSDSGPAKELRDKFIFKIVPMLNPDGVIVGNNRCSLAAKDLNRQYRTVIREAFPTIWYTKLMIRRLLEECGVTLYCDLHAHSRKHNIFIYGCENKKISERRLQEQVFPLMLHKNTADKFSFESCKFRVQKIKEGTGRVVMWMMGISNSYTMEASFAGSTLGNRVDTHFTTADFEQMGKSFCQTLLDYADEDPRKEKLRLKIIDRLEKIGSNADEPANILLSDYSSDEGDTSSTSSNEVGRDDEEFIPAPPPPPSPITRRKPKSKQSSPSKMYTKAPSLSRKPLPINKSNLGLLLSEKESLGGSDSETEIDGPKTRIPKAKGMHRRRKKKKIKKKMDSITGVLLEEKFETKRSLSVLDLVPPEKLSNQSCSTRRSKTPQPQPRLTYEKQINITKQLAEVQAKLFSLKNKLWFGIRNGEGPLSWGSGIYSRSIGNGEKKLKKTHKKKDGRDEKGDNKKIKENKQKNEINEKQPKKKSNGLKRQGAIDWTAADSNIQIRKSKSLPENANLKIVWNDDAELTQQEQQDDKLEKKKKKKRGRFAKKSKTLVIAKNFTRNKD